jgi:hypothetical protein
VVEQQKSCIHHDAVSWFNKFEHFKILQNSKFISVAQHMPVSHNLAGDNAVVCYYTTIFFELRCSRGT